MTNLEKLDLLSDVQKELEQTRRERDEYRDEYTRLAASAAVIDAARNNAVARAEQAERERDEAMRALSTERTYRESVERQHTEEKAARERVEADNGALLRLIMGLRRCHPDDLAKELDAAASEAAKAHPGAALLERLRALEAVMGAAGRVAAGANTRGAWDALDEALTAVDALKGAP